MDVLEEYYPGVSFAGVRDEATEIIAGLKASNIQVYLGDQQYFPRTHRGSYYTDTNTFYLNSAHMLDPDVFIKVLRHEGWHAAQDCMAGTIDNSLIAIIMPEDDVPMLWQEMVKRTYMLQPGAIPWEKEAMWAGKTENMTMNALAACAGGNMWEVYEPTPLTRKYLVDFGYIK